MNENDGTITSSPAPTPSTCNARWRAVVQFEMATASSAPTLVAKARSSLATFGPWAIQPDAIAADAASISS